MLIELSAIVFQEYPDDIINEQFPIEIYVTATSRNLGSYVPFRTATDTGQFCYELD
jgi:hypothetical protein